MFIKEFHKHEAIPCERVCKRSQDVKVVIGGLLHAVGWRRGSSLGHKEVSFYDVVSRYWGTIG